MFFVIIFTYLPKVIHNTRECVSTGAAGAQTRRSLGHHLLHPLILGLLVLCAPADFEAQSSLLYNRLYPQIQNPNACPALHPFFSLKLHTTYLRNQ